MTVFVGSNELTVMLMAFHCDQLPVPPFAVGLELVTPRLSALAPFVGLRLWMVNCAKFAATATRAVESDSGPPSR